MKIVTGLVAVLVLALIAIALRNWGAVMQATPIDLFVTTVDISIAAWMLAGLVVVAVLYFATLGRIRMEAALESRELHRELERARRTADKAEESRVADLRGYLEREIPEIELKLDLALERLNVRVQDAPMTRP